MMEEPFIFLPGVFLKAALPRPTTLLFPQPSWMNCLKWPAQRGHWGAECAGASKDQGAGLFYLELSIAMG